MARTHNLERSPSPGGDTSLVKRLKTTHPAAPAPSAAAPPSSDPTGQFAPEVLDHNNIQKLHTSYLASEPFKYAVVEKLFQDELLKKVKDECLSELNFTEKETDIYKVNQTGDLASLSYLTSSQISLLPNLLTLRDALYSQTFRTFLQTVTGCGPLSGKKQDMSVNSYTKGCHLLNHDDVIGTRRVSYILYMPLPHYQLWQRDWGGALELYAVSDNGEPTPLPVKSVPPSWNQFIFFEVQPGKSFHSVEEVVVGGKGEDGRERLSISGWFHAAQEGEEGYIAEPPRPPDVKSSREQLTSTQTVFRSYPETVEQPIPGSTLSEEHVSFLSEFLNPVYLQPRTMKALAQRFVEESSLELHSFLNEPLATKLESGLRTADLHDGFGPGRAQRIPAHTAGLDGRWAVKGPPHKWRYCTLQPREEGQPSVAVSPRAALQSLDELMRSLQDELFPSAAFRAWVAIVSNLLPLRFAVEARRFRPGLDYTLATSEEREARLDVVLGLTPDLKSEGDDGSDGKVLGRMGREEVTGWQLGEWGGWECYMAPHDEEDDPAVYRSSSHKKAAPTNGHDEDAGPSAANGAGRTSKSPSPVVDPDAAAESIMDTAEDEDDNTLLTVQPGFNRLLLVLRDERVMRFVKYVSAAADGSRWDVCGEFEIGMVEEEEEEEEES